MRVILIVRSQLMVKKRVALASHPAHVHRRLGLGALGTQIQLNLRRHERVGVRADLRGTFHDRHVSHLSNSICLLAPLLQRFLALIVPQNALKHLLLTFEPATDLGTFLLDFPHSDLARSRMVLG